MSRIIKCQVNDEYVLGSGVPIGAAGSHGDVILQLQFNDMWDGLSIIATFRDAMNENPSATMLMPTMLVDGEIRTYEVYVPEEAKAIAGRARLTLTGYSVYTINDNGTVTPNVDSLTNTTTAFFRVLESDSAIVDDGSIVDASFAQQAQAEINRAAEAIATAEDAVTKAQEMLVDFDEAENGVFDANGGLITPGRVQNEEARVKAEAERCTAETARVEAEAKRVEAETARKNAETARAAAEGVRVKAEEGRAEAEAKRVEQMEEMKAALDDIIDTNIDANGIPRNKLTADEIEARFVYAEELCVGDDDEVSIDENGISVSNGAKIRINGEEVATKKDINNAGNLGEINTALKSIIAIQNALIGGDA